MSFANKVCGRSVAECLDIIQRFHGWKAPGLVLGLFMVDLAAERVGADVEFDAVVESRHCLPDAVQLFTPCTIGNGWLKVVDWDKYALSFYDRRGRDGWRVWLDLEKSPRYPLFHGWYMQTLDKRRIDHEALLAAIVAAGRSVLSVMPIRMTDLYRRQKKGEIRVCPVCGEAYAGRQGTPCLACQGGGYCASAEAAFAAPPDRSVRA